METSLFLIIPVIFIALAFDFTNGMHDAANSISTIVSTRVLSPRQAVVWAAVFNFVAFLIFGTGVAKTIGKGMVDIEIVTSTVILAGLIGAIAWNLITWYFGLPSSSSHALIGGYAGAAIAKGGFSVIIASGWTKTLIFIIVAPLIGLVLGWVLKVIASWMLQGKSPDGINKWSRIAQLFSAAAFSLGHGGNDAQAGFPRCGGGSQYALSGRGYLRYRQPVSSGSWSTSLSRCFSRPVYFRGEGRRFL
jgi:PiT family inorganic phosphate transporter